MAKYSFEFKKKVVQEYLTGKGGTHYLSKKYQIGNGSNTQLRRWINAYKEFGDNGLMRSRKNENYTFEFKLHMVELYLSTEVSYQDLALSAGMSNYPLITKWVNDFRIAGPDALRPKKKGPKKSMSTSNNKTDVAFTVATPIDTSADHVKQLEDENLKLRIENAYLKELRRLRLFKKKLQRSFKFRSCSCKNNLGN